MTSFTGNPGEVHNAAGADVAALAVTGLFRAHHLELVRLALLMTGDLAAAEDVVQDAFEQLHRRWPSLQRQDSGLAYVRSSVLNGCRSEQSCHGNGRQHSQIQVVTLATGATRTWRTRASGAPWSRLRSRMPGPTVGNRRR